MFLKWYLSYPSLTEEQYLQKISYILSFHSCLNHTDAGLQLAIIFIIDWSADYVNQLTN